MPRGRLAEATIFCTAPLPPHYDPHIVFVTLHPTRRHDQPPLEAAAWLHFGNPPQLPPPTDLGANHTLVILLAQSRVGYRQSSLCSIIRGASGSISASGANRRAASRGCFPLPATLPNTDSAAAALQD